MLQGHEWKEYLGTRFEITISVLIFLATNLLQILINKALTGSLLSGAYNLVILLLLLVLSLIQHFYKIERKLIKQENAKGFHNITTELNRIESTLKLRLEEEELSKNLINFVKSVNDSANTYHVNYNKQFLISEINELNKIVKGDDFYFDDEQYIKELRDRSLVGFCGVSSAGLNVWKETQLIYYLAQSIVISTGFYEDENWENWITKNFYNLKNFESESDNKFVFRFFILDCQYIRNHPILKNRIFDPLMGIHYIGRLPFIIIDKKKLLQTNNLEEFGKNGGNKEIINGILKQRELPDFFLLKNKRVDIWGRSSEGKNRVWRYENNVRSNHIQFLKYLLFICESLYPDFMDNETKDFYRYPFN